MLVAIVQEVDALGKRVKEVDALGKRLASVESALSTAQATIQKLKPVTLEELGPVSDALCQGKAAK
jgi:hypothetical protein